MTDLDNALASMVEASRRFRGAWAGLDDAGRQAGQAMTRLRRRILRAAYRSGLMPWPTPPASCRYPHRARWAGRAPQRRRSR